MYDSGKIIPGLAVFVLLITFPIWYNSLIGDVGAAPVKDPNLSKDMLEYVNLPNGLKHPPAEEMRAKHMEVLKKIHANAVTKMTEQQPSMTCFQCHGTKEQFCDSCHAYASVKTPDCWTCHTKP